LGFLNHQQYVNNFVKNKKEKRLEFFRYFMVIFAVKTTEQEHSLPKPICADQNLVWESSLAPYYAGILLKSLISARTSTS